MRPSNREVLQYPQGYGYSIRRAWLLSADLEAVVSGSACERRREREEGASETRSAPADCEAWLCLRAECECRPGFACPRIATPARGFWNHAIDECWPPYRIAKYVA